MTQRKIFTSTPRKRTYLWNTGHRTEQSQKNEPKSISDVNSAASRVYRIVLWTSDEAESKSKTKKRTSKKNENQILNSQNLNDRKSPKNSTLKGFDKTNLMKPSFKNQKMLKRNPNKTESLNNQNSNEDCSDKKESHENMSEKTKDERSQKRNKYKLEVNKEMQKLFTQQFNEKRKSPNQLKGKNTSLKKMKSKNLGPKFCSPLKQEWIKDQNEADATFDIWNLSRDDNQNNPNLNPDPTTTTTNNDNKDVDNIQLIKFLQSKRNTINQKANLTKTNNSISSINKKCMKKNAIKNSTMPASCTQKPSLRAKSSPKKTSSDNIVSQLYEFPISPSSTDKEKPKKLIKKKKSNTKNELKNALAVDQILKVINKTKIEMESLKKTPLKKDRKKLLS